MGGRRVALSSGPDRSVKGPSRAGLTHAAVVLGVGILLLGLLLIGVLRLLNPTSSFIATGLIGITPLAFLGTPVVLCYGLAKKHRWLSVTGLVLLLIFGYWASADLRFGPGQGDKPIEAVRVATANLSMFNPDPAIAVVQLIQNEPDLILLQELTPEVWATIENLTELEAYPHRQVNPQGNPDGTAIVSRLPFSDQGTLRLGVTPVTWADITIDEQSVRVINVHMAAPVSQKLIDRGATQYAELAAVVEDSPLPVVIVGDLNSTVQHRRLQGLMDQGLSDAHQQAGRGFGATWGQPRLTLVPALLRIDHVLMPSEIEAVHSWTETLSGSDHRMLIVDLATYD